MRWMPTHVMNCASNSMNSVPLTQRTAHTPLREVCPIRYPTMRGYHKRSLNSNGGWNKTSALSFINMPILSYSDEIRSAVLIIHGEKAHSRYFSEDAFKKLKGDNKELLIIPGANHVDLYDQMSVIPFDKIERFFVENFK